MLIDALEGPVHLKRGALRGALWGAGCSAANPAAGFVELSPPVAAHAAALSSRSAESRATNSAAAARTASAAASNAPLRTAHRSFGV